MWREIWELGNMRTTSKRRRNRSSNDTPVGLLRCAQAVLVVLSVSCLVSSGTALTPGADGRYAMTVGEAENITLDVFEEVQVDFSGDLAETVAVSLLQCTGEKSQELKLQLKSAGESSELETSRPACLVLLKPLTEEIDICVFPQMGWGDVMSADMPEDDDIDPTNVVLTMSNEGNVSTVVHLAMFSDVLPPETSTLVIYEDSIAVGDVTGFTLSLQIDFGWNEQQFCESNACIVSGYLVDYEPSLPTAFICFVKSEGEVLYQEEFRGGTSLTADMFLPDDNPYIVTFILSDNAVPNSTSPLLSINEVIVYQALLIEGELSEYSFDAGWLTGPPRFATLTALVVGVMSVSRWMA